MRTLVIGAGVGGSVAAVILEKLGVDVVICEQSDRPRPGGAGLVLWSNATSVLEDLGLGEALTAASQELAEGVVIGASGRELAKFSLGKLRAQTGSPVVGIKRSELMGLLAQPLARLRVRYGMRFTGRTIEPSGVTAHFENGESISADLIIGADGIHSNVRASLLGDAARYAGYVGFRGIARFDALPRGADTATWYYGRGGQFGLVPVGRGEVFWFATANVAESARASLPPAKEFLLSRYGRWTSVIPTFLDTLDPSTILPTPIYDRVVPKLSRAGSVTLLGDAAHAMTPTFGQGACLAIEGSRILAEATARYGADVLSALRYYEAKHFPRAARLVRAARIVGHLIQSERPAVCSMRDCMLKFSPELFHRWSLSTMVGSMGRGGIARG